MLRITIFRATALSSFQPSDSRKHSAIGATNVKVFSIVFIINPAQQLKAPIPAHFPELQFCGKIPYTILKPAAVELCHVVFRRQLDSTCGAGVIRLTPFGCAPERVSDNEISAEVIEIRAKGCLLPSQNSFGGDHMGGEATCVTLGHLALFIRYPLSSFSSHPSLYKQMQYLFGPRLCIINITVNVYNTLII